MRLIAAIISTLLPVISLAIPPEFNQHFSRKEGLSDNRIYSMAQDENGFTWIATHNGLNRFDGKHFKVFHPGNSPLQGNTIWQIKQGPPHYLVLGTRYGLALVDTRTGILENRLIKVRPELMVYVNNIRHVEYTSRGEIIMGTQNGIYITDWKGNPVTQLEAGFDVRDIGTMRLHFSLGIAPFPGGDALLLTKTGYHYYDAGLKKIIPLSDFPKRLQVLRRLLTPRRDSYIFEVDPQGRLYYIDHFGGVDSLFVVDSGLQQLRSYPLPFRVKNNIRWDSKIQFHPNDHITITTANEGFFTFRLNESANRLEELGLRTAAHLFCQYVLTDRAGNYLLGTESGLYLGRAGPSSIQNISMLPFVESNNYHPITTVIRHRGKYWIGGYSTHSGIIVLDSQYQQLQRVDVIRNAVDKNFIISLSPWSEDSLLVGTKFGAYFLDTRKLVVSPFRLAYTNDSISPVYIEKFFRSSNGETWLSGGQVGGIWRINRARDSLIHIRPGRKRGDFPMRNAGAFAEERNGNIWMVHWVDGITRWNPNKRIFDTIGRRWPFAAPANFDCSGIVIDKEGIFWFFINAYGLVRYDPASRQYQKIIATTDQADDNASSLLLVEDSLFWMNLRHSILVYNRNSGKVNALSAQNGLPVGSNYSGELYYDKKSGSVLAGFSNYLTRIPVTVGNGLNAPRKVFITGVFQSGGRVPLNFLEPVRLASNRADLRVEYAVVDYNFSIPISHFEYRLREGDPWIETGTGNSLSLVNLGPGNYHLQIRMTGIGSASGGGLATLAFYVAPAFYQTPWFLAGVGLLVIGLAWLLYQYKIRQLKKIALVREKIALDLHDDLGSRLTHIRFLSAIGEDDTTPENEKKKYLHKITEEATASGEALDEIVHDIQTQQEELEDIAAKMRRYASELFEDDPIMFRMEVAENLHSGKLRSEKKRDLFLCFKEILNNVRKHAAANEVQVRLYITGKQLVLGIADNGIGMRENGNGNNGRNGIRNIHNRMLRWKGKVEIEPGKHRGTAITLWMPVDADSPIKRVFSK